MRAGQTDFEQLPPGDEQRLVYADKHARMALSSGIGRIERAPNVFIQTVTGHWRGDLCGSVSGEI